MCADAGWVPRHPGTKAATTEAATTDAARPRLGPKPRLRRMDPLLRPKCIAKGSSFKLRADR